MDAAVVGDAEVGGGTAELLVEGSFEELLAGNSGAGFELGFQGFGEDPPHHYRFPVSRAHRDRLLDLRGWPG